MDTTTGLAIGIAMVGLAVILTVAFVLQNRINARKQEQGNVQPAQPDLRRNPTAVAALPADAQVEQMRKSIRSWAWISLVMGVVSLLAGNVLSSPWGVVQIMVGLSSFYFYSDYPMFMVYAGVFAIAAILNFATGSTGWTVGAFLQIFWAYQNFRLFNIYQSATRAVFAAAAQSDPFTSAMMSAPPWERPSSPLLENTRAQNVFPWIALFLGLGGAVGFGALFVGLVTLNVFAITREAPNFVEFLLDLAALLSLLGIPFGIASLRGGYEFKAASIIGLVAGGVMFAVYLWLTLIAK